VPTDKGKEKIKKRCSYMPLCKCRGISSTESRQAVGFLIDNKIAF
jgi:hypothetical protein